MTNKTKVIVGLAVIGAVSAWLMMSKKQKKKKEEMLHEIAEEGYEFAHDVLYPMKSRKFSKFF